ncbi:MAG: HPr family phosphocarrier protein [Gammaproteobacteria bacterium]|nr:HPr family phosphocarrier protein [Gammaproteobacteria bacterium]
MISQDIQLINRLGLHARASAKLVKTASGFKSSIEIGRHGQMVNAKSIMGVMMLAAAYGAELKIQVEGTDEELAMDAMTDLINRKFDEED